MLTTSAYRSIPKTTGEEWMSLAYVRMICAQAGLNISKTEFDNGIDLQIGSTKPVGGTAPIANVFVALQLKSTINWEISDGVINYPLEAKAYNQLATRSAMDQYLVLCTLPHSRAQWLTQHQGNAMTPAFPSHSNPHSVFANGVYYMSLADRAPLGDNPGTGKPYTRKTVSIPVSQRLTAVGLHKLYKEALERNHA